MRKNRVYPVLFAILILSSLVLPRFPNAHAAPSYAPGVVAGDTITYGLVKVNLTQPSPPFFNNLTSIQDKILSVDTTTNTVSLNLTFTYANTSQTTQSITGTTDTGQGNLFPYLLAGGLQAGDPIFNSTQSFLSRYILNETTNRYYAGAVRLVNVLTFSAQYPGYSVSETFYLDKATGFLDEVSVRETFNSSQGPQSFNLYFKATSTNAWTSETTPDYTLDTSSPPGGIYLGQNGTFSINIASINNLNATIQVGPFFATNMTGQPSLKVSPSTVSISKQTPTTTSTLTVSTNATTAIGDYLVILDSTSGTIVRQDRLIVEILPPDFEIAANPPNLTIAPGHSENSTITISSEGLFKGVVNLFTQPFQNGIGTGLSQSTISLDSTHASGTSILTVSILNGTLPTQSGVSVTGQGPNTSHSVSLAINITGPDFAIIATPTQISLKQGTTTTTTITLVSHQGFKGPVTLTTPFGFNQLTVSLSQTVLNLTAGAKLNATLTIAASNLIPPSSIFGEIVGTASNGQSHYVDIFITVTGPDFIFPNSFLQLSVRAGHSTTQTITVSRIENFNGTIQLSLSTGPGNFQASLSTTSIVLNSTQKTARFNLTVSVPAGSIEGFGSLSITGQSGILSHQIYAQIQIIGPDFTISANPVQLSIPENGTGHTTITVTSLTGFSGNITLSTPFSSPLIATLSQTSLSLHPNATATTTLTIQPQPGTVPGSYGVSVDATNGTLNRSLFVPVQVTGPDFSIFTSPSNISIQQGGAFNDTITLTSIDNFSGNVTVTAESTSLQAVPFSMVLTLKPNSTATTTFKISANGLNPGFYQVQFVATGGHLGTLGHYAYTFVQVAGPDFSIFATPSFVTLHPGTSTTTTLNLDSVDGFAGNVSLGIFSQFGVTGSLAKTTVSLSKGGSASTTLTVMAPLGLANGFYSIQVNATSGSLTHNAFVDVQIVAPDFNIQLSQFDLTVKAGASTADTLTLSSLNGFNGTISLSAFQPLGLGVVFDKSIITLTSGGSQTINLNVTASPTSAGQQFFVTIQASSGSIFHSTTIIVNVTGPSFSLTVTPFFQTITAGNSSTATATVNSSGGFTGNVTLTPPPFLPFGFKITLTQTNLTLTSGGSATSTLTITVASSTAPGVYGLSLMATSGQTVRSSFFEVQVAGPPFIMSAVPSFLEIPRGENGTSTISISGSFTSLFLSGSANRPGLSFSLNPQTVTNSTFARSTLAITVPANASTGLYTITVTATGQGHNQTVSVNVLVPVPDISISTPVFSINVFQGESSLVPITVSSLGGFAGNVTLAAFSFSSSNFNSTLTLSTLLLAPGFSNTTLLRITAFSNATLGTYFVQVSAAANGANVVHVLDIQVNILGHPNFTISAVPSAISFVQNQSATSNVFLTSINQFQGLVTLTATSAPAGPSIGLANTIFVASTTQTPLTVSSGTNVVGHFTVTITATAGNITHTVTVAVTILPQPDFTIVASSPTSIISGRTVIMPVTLSSMNGFSGIVNLVPIASAGGLQATFNQTAPVLSPNGSIVDALTLSAGFANPGNYTVTILASSGPITHSAIFSLIVLPAPGFTITTTSRITMSAGSASTSSLTVKPLHGFSGPVTLTTQGPVIIASSFSPSTILGGSGPSNMTLTVASNVPQTSYAVLIVATSGSITNSTFVTVTVNAPSPATVSVGTLTWIHRVSISRGGLETWTVSITNTGSIPIYVQDQAFSVTGVNATLTAHSSLIKILPQSTVTITLSEKFATVGRYSFDTLLSYSTVVDQSGQLINPLTVDTGTGSFNVNK